MGQEDLSKRQSVGQQQISYKPKNASIDDFVLEKNIFNNVFEKDIRRVFIYKKAERLAKALRLITPAFSESVSLRDRIDAIAVGLVDAAIAASGTSRTTLSRELLALSSVLSVARVGGLLSSMNADLISREAYLLLQEVAAYEEPILQLDDVPTLSTIARQQTLLGPKKTARETTVSKGHLKDRSESILAIIKDKKRASIKDISTRIRGVSEKTIQRELSTLIYRGMVLKEGNRRWSTYSLI